MHYNLEILAALEVGGSAHSYRKSEVQANAICLTAHGELNTRVQALGLSSDSVTSLLPCPLSRLAIQKTLIKTLEPLEALEY